MTVAFSASVPKSDQSFPVRDESLISLASTNTYAVRVLGGFAVWFQKQGV